MLFKRSHVPLILSGKKTVTRRTWKKPRVKVGGTYKAKTKMLSKDYFALLKVVDLKKKKLGEMTNDDALGEGYKTLRDFIVIWRIINGKWKPNQKVWVVEFEVVKES